MRDLDEIRAAAEAWCRAWNAGDLDAVMAHYAEAVAFSSPTVIERWGKPDGWLHGRDTLRANFAIGIAKPGLRFDLVDVLHGAAGAHAVLYRRETGALVVDLVELDADGRACRVVACYGRAGPSRGKVVGAAGFEPTTPSPPD